MNTDRPTDLRPPSQGPPSTAERRGDVIGPYKLLELIGEGGFGVGHAEDARGALGKLRELMLLDNFRNDEECIAFLREATDLIEGRGASGK